jgi:hypothetical protein
MPLDTLTLSPGSIVTYDDMANPLTRFEVIERVQDRWSTFFRLKNLDDELETELRASDCRQFGWNLVKDGAW